MSTGVDKNFIAVVSEMKEVISIVHRDFPAASSDAVEFAEWIAKEDYKEGAGHGVYYKWNGMDCLEVPYTTEQLYQLFITLKQ